MKRLIIALVVILLLAGVVSEVLLPRMIGDAVAQGMRQHTGSSQVTAAVQKTPALLMLTGSFDKVTISAANAKIDRMTFRALDAVLTDVQLDREKLFTSRTVSIERVHDVDLRATITQDELASYLNQTVKGVKNAVVSITPGRVQASTNFSLGGFASLAITLDGKIVGDGQRVKFVTERFLLNNTPVGNVGGAMLTEIPLLDLKNLPFGVTVRDIVMEQGQVTIYTDNRPK